MNNNLDDIKNNLTLNQIFSFLSAFDAQPVLYEEYIISRTICHINYIIMIIQNCLNVILSVQKKVLIFFN